MFRYVGTDGDELIFQDVRQVGNPDFNESDDFDGQAIQLRISEEELTYSERGTSKTLLPRDLIVSSPSAISANSQTIEIELLKGVMIPVNIDPNNVFNSVLFGDIIRLERALEDPNITGEELTGYLDVFFLGISMLLRVSALS